VALEKVYLRPIAFTYGETARAAVAAGWALPLGDAEVAFAGCEIWSRRAGVIAREVVAAAAIRAALAGRGDQVAARGGTLLERLIAPPAWPDALPRETPLVMGVLNVTPDSFSDGGRFLDPERAIAHGLELWRQGAAIVDVGGESTRPGAELLSAADEIARVLPVVEALAAAGVRVSIDTRKAGVMAAALAAGATMINDVSALRHDPDALAVAARSNVPVVLMHMRGEPATMQKAPAYAHPALDVFDHLEERVAACLAAGISRDRLIVDPGIGFGKTVEHNLEILRHLGLYRGLGVAVMLGVSRKSFIARVADDEPVEARLPGSLAAGLAGVGNGALILRVHDVAATQQALRVWRRLLI
jgi:dihydropteroate synthase